MEFYRVTGRQLEPHHKSTSAWTVGFLGRALVSDFVIDPGRAPLNQRTTQQRRMDSMKTLIAQIKNVVPEGVKIAATIIFAIGVICMTIFAFRAGLADAVAARGGAPPTAILSAASLVMGIGLALWLLALGYIYADAKRRSMP